MCMYNLIYIFHVALKNFHFSTLPSLGKYSVFLHSRQTLPTSSLYFDGKNPVLLEIMHVLIPWASCPLELLVKAAGSSLKWVNLDSSLVSPILESTARTQQFKQGLIVVFKSIFPVLIGRQQCQRTSEIKCCKDGWKVASKTNRMWSAPGIQDIAPVRQ